MGRRRRAKKPGKHKSPFLGYCKCRKKVIDQQHDWIIDPEGAWHEGCYPQDHQITEQEATPDDFTKGLTSEEPVDAI